MIGLIPLFLATFLTYRNSVKSLEDEAYYELSAGDNRQIKQIENYVLERQRDVTTLAKMPLTGEAIEKLTRAWERYGYDSAEYEELAGSYHGFFAYYTESARYQDLFLISWEGNVPLHSGLRLGAGSESRER